VRRVRRAVIGTRGWVFRPPHDIRQGMGDSRTQPVELVARRLLDAGDVAELLGVPKSWVYAETRAGRLPHIVIGRYRRYRLEAVTAWIEEHEAGARGRVGYRESA